MSTIEQALSDFIDAWNAGRRPSVREHLARVPGARARRARRADHDLAEVAPTPAYSDAARAQIRAEPAVRHVLAAVGGDAGLWPAVIPGLRARAGLTVGQLAARLVARFSLGPGSEERTADYLARLERGELEPSRVSRRLLGALGELLGASGDTLADAGRFAGGLRPAAAGGTLFRADGEAERLGGPGPRGAQRRGDAPGAAAARRARPPVHRRRRRLTVLRLRRSTSSRRAPPRSAAARRRPRGPRRPRRPRAGSRPGACRRAPATGREGARARRGGPRAARSPAGATRPRAAARRPRPGAGPGACRRQRELLEPEDDHRGADPVGGGDRHGLLERRIAVDQVLHRGARDEELRRERVGLHLAAGCRSRR